MLILLVGAAAPVRAQIDTDRHIVQTLRPIYFATGIPTSEPTTKETADVKYQVSFRLNMAHNLWGKEFDVFAGYTQISTWNLYSHSSPFYESVYMPCFCTYIPFRNAAGKVNRSLLIGYEHRSNGRDDILSRSLNYGFATYSYTTAYDLTLQATARIGGGWYADTHTMEIYNRYLGYLTFGAAYTTPDKDWDFAMNISPLINRSIANINIEAGYRIGIHVNNPYLFIQWHYGYDDSMRDMITTGHLQQIQDGTLVPVIKDGVEKYYYDGTAPAAPHHYLRFGVIIHPGNFLRCAL